MRLRRLMSANRAIVRELSLPIALRRIVEEARDLVGARYGALGVIGADGGWSSSFTWAWTRRRWPRSGTFPKGREYSER